MNVTHKAQTQWRGRGKFGLWLALCFLVSFPSTLKEKIFWQVRKKNTWIPLISIHKFTQLNTLINFFLFPFLFFFFFSFLKSIQPNEPLKFKDYFTRYSRKHSHIFSPLKSSWKKKKFISWHFMRNSVKTRKVKYIMCILKNIYLMSKQTSEKLRRWRWQVTEWHWPKFVCFWVT